MKRFLYIVSFALVLLIQGYQFQKLEPQIKYYDAKVRYQNGIYTSFPEYKFTKKNETYNNVELKWDIKQDIPRDIRIETQVYITDAEGNNPKLILSDVTPVCEESPNRHLLPLIAIVDESKLGTQCFKKTPIEVKDMGQFRFEVLVPNLPEIGSYYRVDYKVLSSIILFFEASFYGKWGYLE